VSVSEPHRLIWDLATHHDGWDRVHAIMGLAGTTDAEIKGWLLREGFGDWVMKLHTACTRATAGGLLDALSNEHVDDALLTGAGEILRALVTDQAVPDVEISDYADGVAAVEAYLGHVLRSAGTMQQFLVVDGIRRLCRDSERTGWRLRRAGGRRSGGPGSSETRGGFSRGIIGERWRRRHWNLRTARCSTPPSRSPMRSVWIRGTIGSGGW
jgi:hypothetical protein